MSDLPFEEFISDKKKRGDNIVILVPLGCDKKIIYNNMLKHSELVSKNHYMVSASEEEENGNIITYEKLNKYYDENLNTIFFVDNIQIFAFYGSSLLRESKNSNIFIFLVDIINVIQLVYTILLDVSAHIEPLYPKNFCSYIDIDYIVKKTELGTQQYFEYKKRFLEYLSMYDSEKIESHLPDRIKGILNVYLDKAIPNFSSISVENALKRAPKFKTIIVDLLINNKSRHLIKMIDGPEGIDSFISVYEKMENTVKLVVIRSREPLEEKVKKIRSINSNNSPVAILTNFGLSEKMIPNNINYYHITDGGETDDLITIFDILKHKTLSGASNSLNVISHISESANGDFTLNKQAELAFSGRLNSAIAGFADIQKKSLNIYIKGEELYVTNISTLQ